MCSDGSSTDAAPPARPDTGELGQHGFRLVWTEIGSTENPVWKVDVYNGEGELVDSGMGDDREDAILGVAERLLPPDHE